MDPKRHAPVSEHFGRDNLRRLGLLRERTRLTGRDQNPQARDRRQNTIHSSTPNRVIILQPITS
jgi:hypothetical protein